MVRRTKGIVLRTTPFGEADLIVTYLSPDFGLLKIFAKSPRKTKSRFGSSLELLTHSGISFWGKENAPLPRLTQSDIIHPFQSIRDNLPSFLKTSEIVELTLNFIPERDANKKAYLLLLQTLQDIENNPPSPPFSKGGKGGLDLGIIHYKIKFLELTGYAPKLDACARCGRDGYGFHVSEGSILCEACAMGMDTPILLSPGAVKLYANLLTWDPKKVHRIRPSRNLLSELSDMIDMHIHHILTKPLLSKAFIHATSQRL
jgi:DNA repair protein RecO (recombination protein O)